MVIPEAAPSIGPASGPRPGSKAVPDIQTTADGDQLPFEFPPKIRGRSRKRKDRAHHPSPPEPEPESPSPSLIVHVGKDAEEGNERGPVAVGNPVIDQIRRSVGTVGGIVRASAQKKMGANTLSRERWVSGEFKGFISKPGQITYNPYEQQNLYHPSTLPPYKISPPRNPAGSSTFSPYGPSDLSTYPVYISDYFYQGGYATNTYHTGKYRYSGIH